MFSNIIKIVVSDLSSSQRIRRTSSLVNDSRARSRTRVSSRAKKPSQNQKSSLEPESKLSLNAARARSNLSQSQCCQKPGIARAKCSYKKLIRLSSSQTKDLDTRVFTVQFDYLHSEVKESLYQFSRGPTTYPKANTKAAVLLFSLF